MKKYTSLISLICGLRGLIAIVYFNYQVNEIYDELDSVNEIVTLFIYGRNNKIALYILTTIGLITGIISMPGITSKYSRFIGLAGLIICSVNLITLLSTGL